MVSRGVALGLETSLGATQTCTQGTSIHKSPTMRVGLCSVSQESVYEAFLSDRKD